MSIVNRPNPDLDLAEQEMWHSLLGHPAPRKAVPEQPKAPHRPPVTLPDRPVEW